MDRPDPYLCSHLELKFGAGSFYVICTHCKQFWVAVKNKTDSLLDYAQGHHDLFGEKRIKPPGS